MKITLLTGKTFDLENAFDFPFKVKTSFKLKRLSLRVDHKKRVVVLSMPTWYGKKKAFEFRKVIQMGFFAHVGCLKTQNCPHNFSNCTHGNRTNRIILQ